MDNNSDKKRGILYRIYAFFLPVKGDKFFDVIRKIFMIIAIAVFTVSSVYLINYYSVGAGNSAMLKEARSIYKKNETGRDENGMLIKFSELYKKNSDIVGWVSIDGTTVDYPVYQADDNDYYIEHDMSKNASRYGAIFADKNSKIGLGGNSRNVILYGHNMIDGSMFGELLEYTSAKYYSSHPLVEFDTLYDEAKYKIFAVIVTNSEEKDDNGFVFNYMVSEFATDTSFKSYIANVKARSVIDTGIEVNTEDEIITMSTCSYEFENARTVVFARKVRDGESLYTDTSKAKPNPSPLYPQAYYDKHGGSKPETSLLGNDFGDTVKKAEATSSEKEKTTSEESGTKPSDTNQSSSVGEQSSTVPDIKVTVGNYIGKSLTEAKEEISDKGLIVASVIYLKDGNKFNTVKIQSVKKGERIPLGSGIELTVTGSPAVIKMPDFKKMKLKDAKKLADDIGLTITTTYINSIKPFDTVLSQSVAKGEISVDRIVMLYLSNGRSKVSKLIGKSEKSAVKILKKAGFLKYEVKYKETDKKSEVGKVIKQSVKAGKYGNVDDKFTITVGKKPEKKTDGKKKIKKTK